VFKKLDALIGFVFADGLTVALVMFLAVAAVICVANESLSITHRYPLDYGEAPLVDQAVRLAAGQNIYRPDISTPPYGISNYPPLYVAALVPLVKLFGPSFWAGRLLSTLCAWLAALFVALILHSLTQDRLAAAVGGLFLLAFPYVAGWSSLLRIDLLALALSLAGLYVLVRRDTRGGSALAGRTAALPTKVGALPLAGVLLVAAIYTRQSYALAAPLAAFVWLLWRDWRKALVLALWVGGSSLALFLLLNLLTRGGFYFNIVTANVNEYGLERLLWNLGNLWKASALLLCLGGASLLLVWRWNPAWPLVAPYLVAPYLVGAALSALTIGKIGSNVNYFLELCAALSLTAGVLLAWSRRQTVQVLRVALLLLLILQAGKLIETMLREIAEDTRYRLSFTHQLARLEQVVAQTPGAILADEYMGLLTLQGRPLVIQPFEVTQLARVGLWDQTPVVSAIRAREYPLILIHYFPTYAVYKERWMPEMLAAIAQAYVPTDSLANTRVYRPMPESSPVAQVEACPGAAWRLPSSNARDTQQEKGGLNFYGQGNEGTVPVVAVADGRLTRRADWVDVVAIQHDDPRQPGQKVWTTYANLINGSGTESYVAGEFPLGVAGVPVKAGQVIGYQGTWSGRPNWPGWMHVHFAVVKAAEQGAFPAELTAEQLLDPLPYLRLAPTWVCEK